MRLRPCCLLVCLIASVESPARHRWRRIGGRTRCVGAAVATVIGLLAAQVVALDAIRQPVTAGGTSNLPPVWTSVPSTNAAVGQMYEYVLTAMDPDGAPLDFSAIGLPFWLSLVTNDSPGVFGQGTIMTVAGNGTTGFAGNGGPATNAAFRRPYGVASDGAGGFFVADHGNHVIRRVNAAGIVSNYCGTGVAGFSGDGNLAVNAQLRWPIAVRRGGSGALYIADYENHRIRKVVAGVITTLAGSGAPGYSGDGGAATAAQLQLPTDMVEDAAGNVFIADQFNHSIRKVSPGGIITTVAGNGTAGYDGDGGAATNAALNYPCAVELDGGGGLLIADYYNHRVRRVGKDGIIRTIAGTGTEGYAGDGGPATNAMLRYPCGLVWLPDGNLMVADASHVIRRVAPYGIIYTAIGTGVPGFGGDGGPASLAQLDSPYALSLEAGGNLLIADYNNVRIRRVSGGMSRVVKLVGTPPEWAAGISDIRLFVSDGQTNVEQRFNLRVQHAPVWTSLPLRRATVGRLYEYLLGAYDADGDPLTFTAIDIPSWLTLTTRPEGNIETVAGNGRSTFAGDGGAATDASFSTPLGLVCDPNGGFLISDHYNHRVRRVEPNGIIRTVIGNGVPGFSGDGGPATKASIYYPYGMAFDTAGNLYLADERNNRVRRVDRDGIITTVAGTGGTGYNGEGLPATNANLGGPTDVAVDGAGNLFIACYHDNRIRKVDTTGRIWTVAGDGAYAYRGDGGPATNASLARPSGVAVDRGAILIADQYNHRARRIGPDGIIRLFAGGREATYLGDGGPATAASLYQAIDLEGDGRGNAYIADHYHNRIRRVDAGGIITTVAGTGQNGYNGDGIPAIEARLNNPTDVALDGSGNLFIADGLNCRIRRVALGGFVLTGTPGQEDAGVREIVLGVSDGSMTVTQRFQLAVVDMSPPVNLMAYAMGLTRIHVTWYDPSYGQNEYRLERRLGTNRLWVGVASLPPGAMDYVDTGLASGQRYHYRLLAFNEGAIVGFSNEAEVDTWRLPSAPAGLTAWAEGSDAIALKWTDTADDETGFELQRRTGTAGAWETIGELPPNAAEYFDSGLAGNTLYFYRLRAINWVGFSAFSAVASAATESREGPSVGGYMLHVFGTNLTFDGVSRMLPAPASVLSLVGGTLDVVQSAPPGASLQRAAIGFRDENGVAVGTPMEVPMLYGIWCGPLPHVIRDVPVPDGFRAPAVPGTYALWLESFTTVSDPAADFRAVVHTNATSLAHKLGWMTVLPPTLQGVEVRVLPTSGLTGRRVDVPVTLNSTGGEAAVAFSLAFDPTLLADPVVSPGAEAAAAWALVDTSQTGRIGVTLRLPEPVTFTGGVKRLLAVSFRPLRVGTCTVSFEDQPVLREVAYADPETAPKVSWAAGDVVIREPGYEADVWPAPAGDRQVTELDRRRISFFVAGLEQPADSNEFQRADCAPRAGAGNGVLSIADQMQAIRFAAGIDPLTAAAGPWGPATGMGVQGAGTSVASKAAPERMVGIAGETDRILSLSPVSFPRGENAWIPVTLAAQGNESAFAFSLQYDAGLLSFVDVRAIGTATNGTLLPVLGQLAAGRVGFTLSLPAGTVMSAGPQTLVEVCLAAAPGGHTVTTAVDFADSPTPRGTAAADASALVCVYTGGVVTVQGVGAAAGSPTAPGSSAATPVGTNQILLTWADTSGIETGFRVHRQTGVGSWTLIATLSADTEEYMDGGLPAGTDQRYMVEAFNGIGGDFSEVAAGRTWSAMDVWRLDYLGTPFNEGYAADGDDADFDRIPNLLEYALGLNPAVPDDPYGLFRVSVGDGVVIGGQRFFTAEYDLPDWAPTETSVSLQMSTNLVQGWTLEMVPVDQSAMEYGRRIRMRSDQPLGTRGMENVRIKAVRP